LNFLKRLLVLQNLIFLLERDFLFIAIYFPDICKNDFNAFIMQILAVERSLRNRNKILYVKKLLFGVMEHFNLDMEFYHICMSIMKKFWELIKNTSDHVIAGIISSITILCRFKDILPITSLCEFLGICMSTIQVQVKQNIFKVLKVEGFTSLVKSSELIHNIMEEVEAIPKLKQNKVQVIELEINSKRKRNKSRNGKKGKYCYFFLGDLDENFVIISIFLDIDKRINRLKPKKEKIGNFELEIMKFKRIKGPPYLFWR
jgi:hypothetical protein